MGLKQLFLKYRLKKKQQKIDEIASRYNPDLTEGSENALLSRSYISEQCERISISVAELEEARQEYDIVTNYLTDMQLLEDAQEEDKVKIQDVANSILTMQQTREDSLKHQKKISDAQYLYFERFKDEIPGAIRRLKDNEEYQSSLKRDLDILEGEKISWLQEKKHMEHELVWIKKFAVVLFLLFALVMVIAASLYFIDERDMSLTVLISLSITAAGSFALFIRRQNDELLIKQAIVNYNYAISLQNKVKIRYVSITNAVDYTKEYYHVKNTYDFSYQWEQYLEAAKEIERLERTNDDLVYFNGLLLRTLSPYRLYDPRIWTAQALALVEPKEMVELRHELIVRRQKLRARIEEQFQELESSKNEFDGLIQQNSTHQKELGKITLMLDRILERK